MRKEVVAACLGLTLAFASLPGLFRSQAQVLAQAQEYMATSIMPSATDSRIATFDEPHMSWPAPANGRGQLVVFLPGTGGKPRDNFPFALVANSLGYHVISLMYPDNVAAQQDCMNSSDPDAYMRFRLAVITGGDSSGSVHVDAADSIENRLNKLLRYLIVKQPNQGWNQYLDRNGQTAWDKIVITGQSQGGGHAYVIAKYHTVARCITFGSPKDYSHYFNAPARGFDSNTKTPKNRFFAFNHMEDHKGGCNHDQQMQIFQQIGLTTLGQALADQASPPYNHAHLIFTDVQLPDINNPSVAHGSVISGVAPVCRPVWQYVLTEPVQ